MAAVVRRAVTLNISIPDSIAETLRLKLGDGLEQKTKEDLAVQWYREGMITAGQVAEFLGVPWFEAQSLLRSRNAGQSLDLDEVVADADSLKELRQR